MEKQQNSGHLVLVMAPFQGHITPMLQLATLFYSKGFSISIVHTEWNSPNPSNHPEFTFISIPDNLTESQLSDKSLGGLALSINKNCATPLHQCIKKILHSHDRIAAVLYDSLVFCAQAIADDLGVPGITLRTGSATTLLFFPELDEKDFTSESKLAVAELQALRLHHFYSSIWQNRTEAMGEMKVGLTNSVKCSSAIIVNSMEYLERVAISKIKEYFHAPVFAIGPLHKLAPTISSSLLTEDDECISWLNKQAPKSVIYVSFGSLVNISKQELVETAWGLANSELPFLWVVRPGMVDDSEWIESLPDGFQETVGERGCIVKWAPQKEVLSHGAVSGFWSHCGWNSTLESISEGVPMLCKPFGGDQHVNTSYICNVWKIGLELHEMERGNIERAIKRLIVDKEGDEIRDRAIDFKEKAGLCLVEGGSSTCCINELTKLMSPV